MGGRIQWDMVIESTEFEVLDQRPKDDPVRGTPMPHGFFQ